MTEVEAKGSNAGDGLGKLIGYGVFLLVAWFAIAYILPSDWRIKYAMRYFVSYENVTVQDEPTNCDFMRAPIGNKPCHYEKTVSVVSWRNSATGQPLVSYDQGKTWLDGNPPANAKLPTEYVFVDWNKVDDP